MTDSNRYISARKFAGIVGCSTESVAKVAAAARVRIQQLPGLPPRYHRDDADTIAAQSFRVAGSDGSHPTASTIRKPAEV